MNGTLCETISGLPFDDGMSTSAVARTSPMHFTGKQHDSETNLDDFDARYYSSSLGRFISANWSNVPEAVPYADLMNPQMLNLYAMGTTPRRSRTWTDTRTRTYRPKGNCSANLVVSGDAYEDESGEIEFASSPMEAQAQLAQQLQQQIAPNIPTGGAEPLLSQQAESTMKLTA